METLAKTCIPEGIGEAVSRVLTKMLCWPSLEAWDALFYTNRREGSHMGIHAAVWVDVGVGACGSFSGITSIFSVT